MLQLSGIVQARKGRGSVERHVLPFLCASVLVSGCVSAAPATQRSALSGGECAGTSAENACLVLQFSVDPGVREAVSYPLKGTLHWALYKGGDVTIFGPGSNKSVYSGAVEDIDLVSPDATRSVTIPNAEAGMYQALGFLDVIGDGGAVAVAGDPVTLPANPFEVPSDQLTHIAVVFDFIR